MISNQNQASVFVFLFFIFYIKVSGQAYSVSDIDSLQTTESKRLREMGDYNGVVTMEKKLLKRSKELNYTKGEIRGYINLANFLCGLNRNKESFDFLTIADEKLKKFNDAILRTRLNIVYGKNYQTLGLYKESLVRFNNAIRFAYDISDKEDRSQRLNYIYNQKRIIFTERNMLDSVYAMEKKLPINLALYVALSERNIKSKRLDSAAYYLNKGIPLYDEAPIESKSGMLLSFGKFYFEKKEYDQALQYYLKSLDATRKIGLKKSEGATYQLIYQVYKKQKNIEKANEYLEKYTILNDSLTKVERELLDIPVKKIINENSEKEKNNLYYILIAIISLGTVFFIVLHKANENKHKQKDTLIMEKERETDILKKKLTSTFGELVQLAIHNEPLFLGKFKEAYPEFYNSLVLQCPAMTSKEFKLCALVKLNFSNKEISQYDYISIRTVESKKYRLRKKLGLAAGVDFNKWITNL